MKIIIILTILLSIKFGLFAQDIIVAFQAKDAGTIIDSLQATNLNTNQTVSLFGNETIILVKTNTGVHLLQDDARQGKLYPNPCNGMATVSFSTSKSEEVKIQLSNASGQLISGLVQNLEAGVHTFSLQLPGSGIYFVTVQKSNVPLSFKVVSRESKKLSTIILYTGRSEQVFSISGGTQLKSTTVGKNLYYKEGDNIMYTLFSMKNTTVMVEKPTVSKTFQIPFYACTDNDNNNYKTITIGNQVWTVENLKTTKYNDGSAIPNVTDNVQWSNLTTGAYCSYENKESNVATYGRLYNWDAVNTGKLAPAGWHVPTDDDWTIFENYLIANGYNYDGTKDEDKIAKSLCAKTNWALSTEAGTPGATPENNNSSGFTALPGGYRNDDGGGVNYVGKYGHWWSSTEDGENSAYNRGLNYLHEDLYRFSSPKRCGFSVRLVRD
jgi:uncharacterized protein (TIGR02145 family)